MRVKKKKKKSLIMSNFHQMKILQENLKNPLDITNYIKEKPITFLLNKVNFHRLFLLYIFFHKTPNQQQNKLLFMSLKLNRQVLIMSSNYMIKG